MNGYVCFYRGKRVEVYAETTLKAREEANKTFKAKRPHEITTVLAEKDGEEVIHDPASI